MAGHGFAAPSDTPMARLVAVADTDEDAERVARAGAAWTLGAYGHGVGIGAPSRHRHGRAGRGLRPRAHRVGLSRRGCATSWPGSTEEMRLRYLMIAPLSHESFVRFTDEVLVHL